MKITTILPVSRIKYLDKVIESLVNQTYRVEHLIVIFDGNDADFLETRNKLVSSFVGNLLFIKSNNINYALSINERRDNIANIHNQLKELIVDTDWVFSIEDDGIIPNDALEKLIDTAKNYDNVGMVTGVELGRWGVQYVGAWSVDDINDTKLVSSINNRSIEGGIDEIDACGLYCALVRADLYTEHNFFANNGLGPDINLGLFMRQRGFVNYIDWSIHVTHLTNRGGVNFEIYPIGWSNNVKMHLISDNRWNITY